MPTLDDAGFLTALQLADSAFPTGLYAHSLGLEGMVHRGWVRSKAGLEEFLAAQCSCAVLPADGVALLQAHAAAARGDLATVMAIDELLHALRLPQELRTAATQVGRRLLSATAGFHRSRLVATFQQAVATGATPGCAPVAFALVCQALDVPARTALLASMHSYLTGQLNAALRLLPVSHTDTQAILRNLQPVVRRGLEDIQRRDWRDISSFSPQLDIASLTHETDDLRMFAS